jgi:hypothetical protein
LPKTKTKTNTKTEAPRPMIRSNAQRADGVEPAKRDVDRLIDGYTTMVADRIDEGWHPFFLSLMFRQLPGKPAAVIKQMHDEAERVYRTLLPRIVRRPLSSRSLGLLPVLIGAPDVPVGKSDKPLAQVAINDGLHLHGVLVMPPQSRLRVPVAEHFRTRRALYVRPDRPLMTLDVQPIDGAPDAAVDYLLKSLRRRRHSLDDLLVLPRARAEVKDSWHGPDRAA